MGDTSADTADAREVRRIAALDSYRILDTAPESAFDDIVTIASEICQVPMALISLVDSKRQWFKAALGLEVSETPREIAFCAHAIQQQSTMVVPDATGDPRFAANPLVTGSPNLRFYAGTPLVSPDGEALGTLCVLDTRPRTLSARQHAALQALGRQVMNQLEYRKSLIKQRADQKYSELILDSAVDYAIISLDLAGLVKSWNEGAKRIFGWTSEEMFGQPCSRLFTPEDCAAHIPEIEMGNALTLGRGSDERWHLRKDGTRFFASGEMMTLKDDAQQSVGFLKMLRDRTDARRAAQTEPALLELGDRLRDLTNPVQMSYVAAELIGRTLQVSRAGYGTVRSDLMQILVEQDWVSPGVASIAGEDLLSGFGSYVTDLLIGKTVVIDDALTDKRVNQAAFASLGIYAQINVPVVEQGQTVAVFFVHSNVARPWDPAEVEFIRDVAERTRLAVERRRAENQVRVLADSLHLQVEERTAKLNLLASIVERTDIMFMACDIDYKILAINQAAADELHRVYGIRPVVGANLLGLLADQPEQQAHVRAAWSRGLAGEEFTLIEEFGDPRRLRPYYEINFRTLDNAHGERIGCYQFVIDVTERLVAQAALAKAQEELRQSQKMEAVGQLTGGLAHDFNNLLTGITGSLEMIQKKIRQDQAADAERYVLAAQGAAQRAASLTHRLLAFSRRQTLDPKPTDVNRLVTGMRELIQRTIGPSVVLECVEAGGLWSTLIDASQLENALLNLCINARDAMPSGGKLMIEAENRWLDAQAARDCELASGEYVSLSVSDNGTGMASDVVARAFDPFFTTKPIGMGTGLGLSMVYGFARQSGGQVRIQSRVGTGTRVSLYLPRHTGPVSMEDPAISAETIARLNQETVLVVDDEPIVRILVTEVLNEIGCTALDAIDGPTGLEILKTGNRIDLLVTDVGLPGGMNGRQLADAARVSRPDLKVLFITGYAENAVLSHGHLDAGMHVLTKPFGLDDLKRRIKELVSK
jgi:PAS domain S-box-containing protein